MTCKDCINYNWCKKANAAYSDDKVEKLCDGFKDKSEWVHLPCRIGNTVYVIEHCVCYNNYREPAECHRRTRAKNTKFVDVVMSHSKHGCKCFKLYTRPFDVKHIPLIGKTVFIDKDEAEKALAERKEKQ